jgi:hypothetical protein
MDSTSQTTAVSTSQTATNSVGSDAWSPAMPSPSHAKVDCVVSHHWSRAMLRYFAALRRKLRIPDRKPGAPFSPAELRFFAALRRKASQTTTPCG